MYEIEVPLGVDPDSGALIYPALSPKEPHMRVVVEGSFEHDAESFTRKVSRVIGGGTPVTYISGSNASEALRSLSEVWDRQSDGGPSIVVLDIQKTALTEWVGPHESKQHELLGFVRTAVTRRIHVILFANYAILRDFKASWTVTVKNDGREVSARLGSRGFHPFGRVRA